MLLSKNCLQLGNLIFERLQILNVISSWINARLISSIVWRFAINSHAISWVGTPIIVVKIFRMRTRSLIHLTELLINRDPGFYFFFFYYYDSYYSKKVFRIQNSLRIKRILQWAKKNSWLSIRSIRRDCKSKWIPIRGQKTSHYTRFRPWLEKLELELFERNLRRALLQSQHRWWWKLLEA